MPQLIFYALAGLVGWYGYKAIKKEMARISEKVRAAEDKQTDINVGAELEKDLESGVYRLKNDD